MIPSLIAITIALYWLMLETDWLRIRLAQERQQLKDWLNELQDYSLDEVIDGAGITESDLVAEAEYLEERYSHVLPWKAIGSYWERQNNREKMAAIRAHSLISNIKIQWEI